MDSKGILNGSSSFVDVVFILEKSFSRKWPTIGKIDYKLLKAIDWILYNEDIDGILTRDAETELMIGAWVGNVFNLYCTYLRRNSHREKERG